MNRVIAIDYGTKRTGIAVTDPLQIIASPLETVPTHTLFEWLTNYFGRENVSVVVVGRPTQMDGSPSSVTPHIDAFVRKFCTLFPDKRLVRHDERFTSVMAQRAMIDGGVKKMARRDKAMVDRVSAAIILQSYLATEKNLNL